MNLIAVIISSGSKSLSGSGSKWEAQCTVSPDTDTDTDTDTDIDFDFDIVKPAPWIQNYSRERVLLSASEESLTGRS